MTPWCVLEVTCQTLPESSSSLQDVSWLGPWQIQAVFDNCLDLSFLKPWNIDTFQSKFQAKRPETCQHAVLSMTILSLGGLSGLLQINRNHIWLCHGQPLVSCFGMWISLKFDPSVHHHAAQLEDIVKPGGYKWQQSCHMDGWTMMDLCFCQVVSFATHCCYQPQGLHVFHSTLVQDALSCCKRPPPDSPFVNDIKFGPFCLGANAFGWCIWNHAKPPPQDQIPSLPIHDRVETAKYHIVHWFWAC